MTGHCCQNEAESIFPFSPCLQVHESQEQADLCVPPCLDLQRSIIPPVFIKLQPPTCSRRKWKGSGISIEKTKSAPRCSGQAILSTCCQYWERHKFLSVIIRSLMYFQTEQYVEKYELFSLELSSTRQMSSSFQHPFSLFTCFESKQHVTSMHFYIKNTAVDALCTSVSSVKQKNTVRGESLNTFLVEHCFFLGSLCGTAKLLQE